MILVIYYPENTSHLAIALTGLNREKNIYISFFPGNERSLKGFRLHQLNHDRYKDETKSHSRAASVVILPSEESCGYGLSEQAIYDWWRSFNIDKEFFEWFTNNCSTIVFRALREGQIHSRSLGNKMIVEKKWFCTPGNILTYACELNNAFRKPSIENNLLITFAEIKTICELGQRHSPYDQVYSIYLRLKQFSDKGISTLLNKPFCEGIVNAINELSESNAEPISTTDFNIQQCYQRLQSCFASQSEHRINEVITRKLFLPLSEFIDRHLPHFYQDSRDINSSLDEAARLIDENVNPHMQLVQRSDPLPREFQHATLTAFRI